jgi:cytochrome c peroxidase
MTVVTRFVLLGGVGLLGMVTSASLSGQAVPTFSALPSAAPAPADNPTTSDKVALGRLLFWDPILSGNKDVACASCHHPRHGYADGRDLSVGVDGIGLGSARHHSVGSTMPLVKRNSQTILNAAFNGLGPTGPANAAAAPMFWDSRAVSLEAQALLPIGSVEEMRGTSYADADILPEVVSRLDNNTTYRRMFAKAFGGSNPVSVENLARAIAAFERTIVAPNSPFDRYLRGDRSAMSASQIDGMRQFERVGCSNCHNGPMLSDFKTHVLGLIDNAKLTESDTGVGGTYAFRTPSLRNVALTAPYMHNGALSTLDDVLRFYDNRGGGGRGRGGRAAATPAQPPTALDAAPPQNGSVAPQNGPIGQRGRGRAFARNPNVRNDQVDPLFRQLRGLGRSRNDLVAFLRSLTDDEFDKSVPKSVPSGLEVGGRIR